MKERCECTKTANRRKLRMRKDGNQEKMRVAQDDLITKKLRTIQDNTKMLRVRKAK